MKHGVLLIIDDVPGVRDVPQDIIESDGFTVVVGNGKVALDEADVRIFNVGIDDYFLPSITGLGLVRKLLRQNTQIMPTLINGYASNGIAELASRLQQSLFTRETNQRRLALHGNI